MAEKKAIDDQVEAKKKEAKEFEVKMRQKAGTIGNIVGKNAPVSLTEVSAVYLCGDYDQSIAGRQRYGANMASRRGVR